MCSLTRRPARAQRGYHKMSLLYHPDKLGDKSDEDKAAGNAMFIKVSEAYGVLSDEESRRKYDLWVRSGRKRRPAPGDDMGPMPVMCQRTAAGRLPPPGPRVPWRARGWGRGGGVRWCSCI
jgi:curved DNA-binding protein CbpA